jgi:hypothetical protein
MISLFIYIYREEKKKWRRAVIKNHIDKLSFNVVYQNSEKSVRKVDFAKV